MSWLLTPRATQGDLKVIAYSLQGPLRRIIFPLGEHHAAG